VLKRGEVREEAGAEELSREEDDGLMESDPVIQWVVAQKSEWKIRRRVEQILVT